MIYKKKTRDNRVLFSIVLNLFVFKIVFSNMGIKIILYYFLKIRSVWKILFKNIFRERKSDKR